MTVLPELERQLVRAAAGGQAKRSGVRRGWGAVAFGIAVVAAVMLVFATLGSRRTPAGAPRPAAPTVDPIVPATYAQACARMGDCATELRSAPVPAALRRPFRVPQLRPGERCPTTAGSHFKNRALIGLGSVPVRPGINNRGDLTHGRIVLRRTYIPGWFGINVIWESLPSYRGPWSVRAVRLSGEGRIELKSNPAPHPGLGGSRSSSTALVLPPGVSSNPVAEYRYDMRTTWISAPGCYAFEVAGLGFSQLMVFQALPAR